MTNPEELDDLMVELLENNTERNEATVCFSARGREIIDEISDYAEQTQIFQKNKEHGEMFDCAPLQHVFEYMLDRIVNAPTTIHRDASIFLIMPFVRQKLREKEGAANA